MEGRGEDAVAAIVGEEYCDRGTERRLTVHKTCLFYPGDGFAVYERRRAGDGGRGKVAGDERAGELVFRVENYGYGHGSGPALLQQRRADHVVLMGPQGQCILTLRRKRPSLHNRWEGFLCTDEECNTRRPKEENRPHHHHQCPLFSIRRSSIISRFGGGGSDSFLVEVYPEPQHHCQHPRPLEFYVEGSFPNRCCTIQTSCGGGGSNGAEAGEGIVVAEITRKVDDSTNVVLGRDVFSLRLSCGFDAAFMMGLVLALDQITNDQEEEDVAAEVEEATANFSQ